MTGRIGKLVHWQWEQTDQQPMCKRWILPFRSFHYFADQVGKR